MAVFGINRAGSTVGPEGSGVAKLRVDWRGVDSRAGVDRAGMSEAVARIRGSIEIAKPDDVGPPVVRSGCRTYAGLQDRSAALTRCGREVSGPAATQPHPGANDRALRAPCLGHHEAVGCPHRRQHRQRPGSRWGRCQKVCGVARTGAAGPLTPTSTGVFVVEITLLRPHPRWATASERNRG